MLGRIMLGIAGLVVLALFTALVAPYFVDWTGFRQDFERRASLILGKKVEVHGAVSARLIPFPSVTMEDVTIGRDDDGKPLVTASRFAMDMEIAPFLSGEARIFEMRIIEPKVHIALQKDGTLDWAKTGNPSIPAKIVVLENVRVSGGEVTFDDHQTGRTRKLTGLDFVASAKSLVGPWHFEGKGLIDGVAGKFTINTGIRDAKGEVRVASHVTPDALPVTADLEGTLRLVDLKLRYDGTFNAAYGAKKPGDPAPVRIKGAFELASDHVRLPQYQLDMGAVSDPYSITGEATLDTGLNPQFLLTAEGQQVDMNAIGASGEGAKRSRSEQVVTAEERLETFLALLSDIPVPPVPGKATLKLPAIVSADTSFRDVMVVAEPNGTGWKLDRASVELPGRTKVEASGLLDLSEKRSFKGTLTAASSQPSGLSAWLAGDVAPQIRSLNALGFSADVTIDDEIQSFDNLELAAGGAILKGRIERQVPDNGDAASLAIKLSGGDLDFDAMRAVASLATGKETSAAFLAQTISADLEFRNLASQGIVASDVATAFTLKNGKLVLDRLAVGDLAGATIEMAGTASGSVAAPVLDLKGRLKAVDPRGFLLLAERNLPHHPVVSALANNAHYFADTNVAFELASAKSGSFPVVATVQGTTNGTKLAVKLQGQDIGLSPGTNLDIQANAENDNYATLLGQAGFRLLPMLDGNHGAASVKMTRTGSAPAQIVLNAQTATTGFNAKGTGDLSAAHFLEGQYKVLLDSEDVEPFLLVTGYSLPNMGGGLPLSVTATLDIKPDGFVLSSLAGKALDENVAGGLTLSRDATQMLTGELSVKTLDAGWLAELVSGPLKDANGAFSSQAFPAPVTGPFAADVRISAANLWLGYPVPVSDFAGRLRYSAGAVAIEDATGQFSGGAAKGGLSLTVGQGQAFLRGKFNVKGADIGKLSWRTGDDIPILSGSADIALGLESSGANLKQIAGQLSGSGNVTIPTLQISGFNGAALPAVLAAADKLEGEINAAKVVSMVAPIVVKGQTRLDGVTLPFSISNGRLLVQNVRAETPDLRLGLDGSVGLAEGVIRADLRAAYAAGTDDVAGATPALVMRFGGTLASPTSSIDATELANYLSLRAFERERRKADLLQARLAERQRLRREALYYRSLDDAREKARIEAEKKAEAERLAEEAAAKAAAEKAAADKAAADKAAADKAASDKSSGDKSGQKTNSIPRLKNPAAGFGVPGFQPDVIRGGELAPPGAH
ncbi:AsmA family protein [Rhizobium sp. C4]|uniref:AsmA family protein n=1 Tax=Rhizobium sp. C4 TaxID=1349800 RepID=UPI001E5CF7A3|nr:AsmA-like C-terminal region-containing protein [Rhizobium sp. C4]MCD2173172.1 AsmA family protein [Rhizobium sp. C4]